MNGESAEVESVETPADSQVAPDSRRLRIAELALVVGVGFLIPTVYSLYHWWNGLETPPEDSLSSVTRILEAVLVISLLAYVLHKQGRSLRTLGLTARVSDIPWALLIAFFSRLLTIVVAAGLVTFSISAPKTDHPAAPGLLEWLAVVPGAAVEELIVRAFLMTEVAALTGSMGIAVLASVGFQTLYHLYWGTPAALVQAGMFFVYAAFYASTRRITPVILAHSLHNFWVLATQAS